jgi:outer membrane immunogenic protein
LAVKSILLGVAVALVAGTAFAADMPVKAPPMAPPAPTWTGTYIGINGGYGWATTNHSDFGAFNSGDFNHNGGLAGVTYGGNWQAGHVVLGFETDLDWANLNGSTSVAACSAGGGTICFTKDKWFSTERMRAGWDFDGWLVYGTLGAAFADVKAGQNGCVICGEKTRGGWTAGVGVETMFWHNWSAKVEYLHYDLGNDITYNFATPVKVRDNGDLVRAGINYHFDMLSLFSFLR